MKYTAAAIQFDPVLGRPEENLSRLLAMIEEAASNGARLIVAPEMAPSGYCFYDRQEIEPYVEPVPGPLTDRLGDVAQRFGCVIVCGLAEVEEQTGLYFNTAAVVGPDGFIGKYRKVHHFVADAKWSVEGDLGFPVWDTPVGHIGVEICMDAVYPESGRLLALQGAHVICFPTNWVGSGGCPSQRWISQAYENGVYLMAADRSGTERDVEFQGGSCVVDPNGNVQSMTTTGDAIVYGEIDLHGWHRRFDEDGREDKLLDRRPELYREMLQNTYGWSANYYHTLYRSPGLPESRQSHVGALQFQPEPGNPGRNIETILRLLTGANLDLAVLPELAVSGHPSGDDARSASDRNGLLDLDALIELSRATSSLLVTSTVEAADATLYNTAVLIGPDGLLGSHRKRHLSRDDLAWASPGNEPLRTYDTPVGRLGLLAGYDALFWESIRVLATQGADLICIPAGLRWPRRQVIGQTECDWVHWRSKAWESSVALAIANYPGPEFAGNSQVFIPAVKDEDSQEALADHDEEALVSLPLDTGSRYLREKRGLSWRRLHAYRLLVEAPRVPVLA